MDRREFLLQSAALAVGTATGELPTLTKARQGMAPPVLKQTATSVAERFTWQAGEMIFAFEFSGDRLRFRSFLPRGVAEPKNVLANQDDYRRYAAIVPGASAALLPEHMGVWSQPLAQASPQAASCNMVNAMLGRIHQSGFLTELSPGGLLGRRARLVRWLQWEESHEQT